MNDAFCFHAFIGWQPIDIDRKTLRASHYDDRWNPAFGEGELLIRRQVLAHCACHAIGRFREWQQEGYGDSWLLLQPVGRKCEEYTVVSMCQPRWADGRPKGHH